MGILNWLQGISGKLRPLIDESKSCSSYEDFLATVVEVVVDNDNNQKIVYSLLKKNLDKLDDNFAILLQNLAINTTNVDSDDSQGVAAALTCFSLQLQQFPLGSKDNNLEIAIIGYQKALEVFTRKDFPNQWADIYNNLSVALWERIRGDRAENLEFAIICCENALLVYTPEVDPEGWALAQSNLANAYSQRIQGDKAENLEKAIICCENALQVYSPQSHPTDWSRTQINLANAYLYRLQGEQAENLEKAITHYQNALQVIDRKSFPEQWALIQHNLVGAYIERIFGNRDENIELAIACGKNALQVYQPQTFPERWATIQNELAISYSKRILGNRNQNLKTAIKLFKKALNILNPEAFPQRYIGTLTNLGFSYQGLGQELNAYNAFASAIDTVESLRLDISSGDEAKRKLAEEYNRLYQSMVEVCVALACDEPSYGRKAVEYVERSKARNLVELLADRDRYPKGITPEVSKQLDQLRHDIRIEQQRLDIEEKKGSLVSTLSSSEEYVNLNSLFTPKILSRSHLTELQQKLDRLITNEIQPLDSSFTLTQKVEPIAFQEIPKLLPDAQTTLIEWYILDEVFLTFIITAQSVLYIWVSDPSDLQALLDWNTEYLNHYNNQKSQWKSNLTSQLENLAKILHLNEILSYVPVECDRLILIPHRFLHLFPLHALPLANGDILLDRFERGISYAPSCQLLQLTRKQTSLNFSRFFAIQNPTSDLSYSNVEVETVSSFFPSVDVLVKQTATKAALNASINLSSTSCYHFSCHGEFNLSFPLESALILANNERLTLGEIFEINLNQCSLVTLSACETGLTDSSSLSDEYVGLPSGFLYAGSPNIVSSLWTVDDLSTAFLMIKFYQNLHKGLAVALALNQAQLWLKDLTKGDLEKWIEQNQLLLQPAVRMGLRRRLYKLAEDVKPFKSPFYWGAFCAIGQ
ncbi:CHAT domain-containing protein [Nostoc sp. FACHB-87]|uniref:CHAT domain-containing protein n=1 Tax=Nostocaceae TaxID=1162 RepID=UPI0016835DED|nr:MULTISPECIES: CHAT domain-containing protein [Nostocaceae]MBD2457074.1 CHAT domain-containing protein [Nostoc sp. FACHB-87]MBD2478260.1 CHAT domain-containing protein [Anabaena sp. FACHB-83]